MTKREIIKKVVHTYEFWTLDENDVPEEGCGYSFNYDIEKQDVILMSPEEVEQYSQCLVAVEEGRMYNAGVTTHETEMEKIKVKCHKCGEEIEIFIPKN